MSGGGLKTKLEQEITVDRSPSSRQWLPGRETKLPTTRRKHVAIKNTKLLAYERN